jgi:hypothetical protein
MSKRVLFGWTLMLAGTVLWLYGYFFSGHPSLINWQADAPKWIAEFLPNIETEIGMILMFAGMVPAYWPYTRVDGEIDQDST